MDSLRVGTLDVHLLGAADFEGFPTKVVRTCQVLGTDQTGDERLAASPLRLRRPNLQSSPGGSRVQCSRTRPPRPKGCSV